METGRTRSGGGGGSGSGGDTTTINGGGGGGERDLLVGHYMGQRDRQLCIARRRMWMGGEG